MRVHSVWLETDALSDMIRSAAVYLGADPDSEAFQRDSARLIPISLSFVDRNDTPWEASATQGMWHSGVVEVRILTVDAERISRLVGIVSPSSALAEDLLKQLE